MWGVFLVQQIIRVVNWMQESERVSNVCLALRVWTQLICMWDYRDASIIHTVGWNSSSEMGCGKACNNDPQWWTDDCLLSPTAAVMLHKSPLKHKHTETKPDRKLNKHFWFLFHMQNALHLAQLLNEKSILQGQQRVLTAFLRWSLSHLQYS